MMTTIGTRLSSALSSGVVNRDAVWGQIQCAVAELHAIGFAHCDISGNNAFIDDDGIVFLADLEYLTHVSAQPPHLTRLSTTSVDAILTASDLDSSQLTTFQNELYRM